MRVVTFNVLSGRSPSDGRVDLERFAAAVAELDADILALQEVDRDQPRSAGADLTQIAAAAMGAVAQRFAPTLVGTPGFRWRPARDDDQPGQPMYGVALLSRLPASDFQVLRLPAPPLIVPVWGPGLRRPVMIREEPRAVLSATISGPFGSFVAACTHVSFVPGWNRWQLRRATKTLERGKRCLLLGDLNLRNDRPARQTGWRSLGTAATYPADTPKSQLDHVLAHGDFPPVTRFEARQLSVSDHRALVVDIAAESA